MKTSLGNRIVLFTFAFVACFCLPLCAQQAAQGREILPADAGWRFLLGDPQGAEAPAFADSSWRSVDLPHDWSIEASPEKKNPSGSGGGYAPGGVGWYRRMFTAPARWQGKRVSVEFDGVYRDATVYLNGQKLGMHPYGYTSFSFDLTPGLKPGAQNTLAVRVDNSAEPNSRWYSGSGIYRHVRVVVTDPVHVAQWGVFVTTPAVSEQTAQVVIHTTLANDSEAARSVELETAVDSRTGVEAGKANTRITVPAHKEMEVSQAVTLPNPALWSPATPSLYRAVSTLRGNGTVTDQVTTPFGVRSLRWTAEQGLLLNGKAIKLTGGSVHHDNGPLGAAAFDRAEERKVELLKAAGDNAVRTAHNPPSPAFLEACDRLGLLVLDEPFDTWHVAKVKYDYSHDFDAWWRRDISSLVLRDRNHPSIVIWGIGNEIPELETSEGKGLGKQLADQVRSLDNTRPLTLAFPGSTTTPNAAAVFSQLDITGYNYNLLQTFQEDHKKLPERLMLTTESYPAKAFPLWQASHDNAYVLGDLTWTAMDYLGESGIGAWTYGTPEQAEIAKQMSAAMASTATVDKFFLGMTQGKTMDDMMAGAASDPAAKAIGAVFFHDYPWHAAACGDMDLTGYRKPQSYYRDILWNGGDRVYATVRLPEPEGKKIIAIGWATYPSLPSWTWPEQSGKDMQVEVYSGAEKVRLYLNGKLLGEKPTGREQEFKATFSVPYTPGTLKAVGLRGDRAVAESILTTADQPAKLRLTADRTVLQADGQDLAYVTVEAVDAQGRLQPNADQEVQLAVSGAGMLAGAANGDGQDVTSYVSSHRKLFEGRALLVLRTSKQSGPIHVTAKASGLAEGSATLEAQQASSRPELQ